MFDLSNPAHPSLPPAFVAAMDEAVARIEAHPEGFDMAAWCGTACCIGGHLLEGLVGAQVRQWQTVVHAPPALNLCDPISRLAFHFGVPVGLMSALLLPRAAGGPAYMQAVRPAHVRQVWDHLRVTGAVNWPTLIVPDGVNARSARPTGWAPDPDVALTPAEA